MGDGNELRWLLLVEGVDVAEGESCSRCDESDCAVDSAACSCSRCDAASIGGRRVGLCSVASLTPKSKTNEEHRFCLCCSVVDDDFDN